MGSAFNRSWTVRPRFFLILTNFFQYILLLFRLSPNKHSIKSNPLDYIHCIKFMPMQSVIIRYVSFYRIYHCSGSFSVVKLGRNRQTGSLAAIKIIEKDSLFDVMTKKRVCIHLSVFVAFSAFACLSDIYSTRHHRQSLWLETDFCRSA